MMNLYDRHVLDIIAPRHPVELKRVYALPLVAYNLDYTQTAIHVLHGFALARDRAFKDRVGERRNVVGKLKHSLGEPALYELILHFSFHALDTFVSLELHRTHGCVFHARRQLLQIGLCGLFSASCVVLHKILLHDALHRSLDVWGYLRERRSGYAPWFVGTNA